MNPKAASPHKCPQVGRTVKRRAQLRGCPSGGGMLPGIRLPASDAIPGRGVARQSVPFHVQDGRRVSSLHLSHRASRGVTAAVQVETACPGLRLGNVLFALQKTQVCPGDPDSGWRWGRERARAAEPDPARELPRLPELEKVPSSHRCVQMCRPSTEPPSTPAHGGQLHSGPHRAVPAEACAPAPVVTPKGRGLGPRVCSHRWGAVPTRPVFSLHQLEPRCNQRAFCLRRRS